MIKKLIISAVILTALISGKESHAAGAGGFARALAMAPAVHVQLAQNHLEPRQTLGSEILSLDQRQELLGVNSGVNGTIADLDTYLGGFDQAAATDMQAKTCFDCADIKRDQLQAMGWSKDRMRIAYAVTAEGRIERVLVVSSRQGEIVLGNDAPLVDFSGSEPVQVSAPFAPVDAISI
ncbi:transglutaminase-like cysteine peptidase [Neorhizobium lilium]|nr:transglutaminase-like cysteine peptidase [Neorhizobium lilium]